jgi:hypothetical protein
MKMGIWAMRPMLPLFVVQVAEAQTLAIHAGLYGKQALYQLLPAHFHREDAYSAATRGGVVGYA